MRLLTRTTRVVRVTEAGARYLEDARRIMMELDEADAVAAGVNAAPCGHLAVTAPVLFGKLYVMPVITEYQSAFEQTSVSALFVDRLVNLVEEGIDVGIRIGQLPVRRCARSVSDRCAGSLWAPRHTSTSTACPKRRRIW